MLDVQACRGCLTTSGKLVKVNETARRIFECITGLEFNTNDGFPLHLCTECRSFVKKSISFRRRCRRSHFVLQQIIRSKDVVLLSDITNVDRRKHNLKTSLGIWNAEHHICLKYVEKESEVQDTEVSTELAIKELQTYIKIKNVGSVDKQTISGMVKYEPRINNKSTILLINISDTDDQVIDDTNKNAMNQNNFDDDRNYDFTNDNDFDADIDMNDVFAGLDDKDARISSDDDGFEDKFKTCVKRKKKGGKKILMKHEDVKKHVHALKNATVIALTHEKQMDVRAKKLLRKQFVEADFKCLSCASVFRDFEAIKPHIQMHNQIDFKYNCNICSVRFEFAWQLMYHKAAKHLYKFKCKICSQVSYSLDKLIKHINNHNLKGNIIENNIFKKYIEEVSLTPAEICLSKSKQVGSFQCSYCDSKYVSEMLLRRHIESHKPDRKELLLCDICTLTFQKRSTLTMHMIANHRYKYRCKICGDTVLKRNAAQKHLEKHKIKMYQCNHCDSHYTTNTGLNVHIVSAHAGEVLLHHCTICAEYFKSEARMFDHQMRMHGYFLNSRDTPAVFPSCVECDKCMVQFVDASVYQRHVMLRHPRDVTDVSNVCESCKNVFNTKDDLKNHICRTDTDAVKYPRQCTYCNELISSGMENKAHHFEKHASLPYIYSAQTRMVVCYICGTTVLSHKIKEHENKYHKSDSEFTMQKCIICKSDSKSPTALLIHMLRHSEKPFQCVTCLKYFSKRESCKLHVMRVHLNITPYKCDLCKKVYTDFGSLSEHSQKVHGLKLSSKNDKFYLPPIKVAPYDRALVLYPRMRVNLSSLNLPDFTDKVNIELYNFKNELMKTVTENKSQYIVTSDINNEIEQLKENAKRKVKENNLNKTTKRKKKNSKIKRSAGGESTALNLPTSSFDGNNFIDENYCSTDEVKAAVKEIIIGNNKKYCIDNKVTPKVEVIMVDDHEKQVKGRDMPSLVAKTPERQANFKEKQGDNVYLDAGNEGLNDPVTSQVDDEISNTTVEENVLEIDEENFVVVDGEPFCLIDGILYRIEN